MTSRHRVNFGNPKRRRKWRVKGLVIGAALSVGIAGLQYLFGRESLGPKLADLDWLTLVSGLSLGWAFLWSQHLCGRHTCSLQITTPTSDRQRRDPPCRRAGRRTQSWRRSQPVDATHSLNLSAGEWGRKPHFFAGALRARVAGRDPSSQKALWPAVMRTAPTGRTHGRADQRCRASKNPCQRRAVHTRRDAVVRRGKTT